MNLNSFLKEVFTGDNIHDFQHASNVFRTDSYRLSPKYAFLYYLRITLDVALTGFPDNRRQEIGALVKSTSLPKFTVDTKTMNAYNRPNIVQTKMKYDPIEIKFHDDSDDLIREFWYDYYSFYYRDSDHSAADYGQEHKYVPRMSEDWGFSNRGGAWALPIGSTANIIKEISIFSFHQKRFSEYVLYNPIITAFRHGEHSSAGNDGVMEHSMTVAYEAVKYRKGFVTKNNFADMMLHYDQSPSPLTPAGGGTQSILGPGGALDSANDIIGDLAAGNFGSALFKGGRGLQNFKGADLKALAKGELFDLGKDILRGGNPLSKIKVPSLSGLFGGGGGEGQGGGGASGSVIAAGGIATAGYIVNQLGDGSSQGTVATPNRSSRKSQEILPSVANPNITSNGSAVGQAGNPLNIPTPSFPAITPGGVTGAVTKFADGAAKMNDSKDVSLLASVKNKVQGFFS